jgi:hypothetical protein
MPVQERWQPEKIMKRQPNKRPDYYLNQDSFSLRKIAVSEFSPLAICALVTLVYWHHFLFLFLLAALILRFLFSMQHSAQENTDISTVSLNAKSHSLFTKMLDQSYPVYMPYYMYQLCALAILVGAIEMLSISILFLPVSLWLFNWARAYGRIGKLIKLGQQTKSKPRADFETHQEAPQPHPDIDIPEPAKEKPKENRIFEKEKKKEQERKPYTSYLIRMQELERELNEKTDTLNEYLETIFGHSEITKDKYRREILAAQNFMSEQKDKVEKTIRLFGNSEETAERKEILNQYIYDSKTLVSQVDDVINELIKLEQSESIKDRSLLDESLSNLAHTTHYYSKNS